MAIGQFGPIFGLIADRRYSQLTLASRLVFILSGENGVIVRQPHLLPYVPPVFHIPQLVSSLAERRRPDSPDSPSADDDRRSASCGTIGSGQ